MKLNLTDLANLQNEASAVSTIASNNTLIENAIENTLSLDGTSPNALTADLDVNSNRIINLPDAVQADEPVTLRQFNVVLAAEHAGLGLANTSTNNAIVRFDGLAGNTQNSGVIIDDDNAVTFPGNIAALAIDGSAPRIRFYDSGGLGLSSHLNAPIHFDLTKLSSNQKHGMTFDVRTDSSTGTINSNAIVVQHYSPPDNGGDVSGIYSLATGGGNAISAFNLGAERTLGYTNYPANGFAIEAQSDYQKHSIFTSALDGTSLLAVPRGAGTAVSVIPEVAATGEAFHVGNVGNTLTNFGVSLAGNVFARGTLTVTGTSSLSTTSLGGTTVTSSGGNALVVSATAAAGTVGGLSVIAPNLPNGGIVGTGIGVVANTLNQGTVNFSYAGSGSTSNALLLGLFGNSNILTLSGNSSASFSGNVSIKNGSVPYALAQSFVAVPHTGDTSGTMLASVLVPANSMGPNGFIRIFHRWNVTTSGNNKTYSIRLNSSAAIGGTAIFSTVQTTNINSDGVITIGNRNATNSQSAQVSNFTGIGTSTSARVTPTRDTTADMYVIFDCVNANAGDTTTLEGYVIEVCYGA